MYTKIIPFKDYKNRPRNMEVQFNLEIREVVKLLVEFNAIFKWQESMKGEKRDLSSEEVVDFYNAFEAVLLAAWGVLDEDGLHFRKTGRYDFEESKLFAACMEIYVSEPQETNKLVEGIMPPNMKELVAKAEGSMDKLSADPQTPDVVRAEIARLQAQLPSDTPASN